MVEKENERQGSGLIKVGGNKEEERKKEGKGRKGSKEENEEGTDSTGDTGGDKRKGY